MVADIMETIQATERLGHNIVFCGGHVCLHCRLKLKEINLAQACGSRMVDELNPIQDPDYRETPAMAISGHSF